MLVLFLAATPFFFALFLKVESVDPTSTYTAISNWTTCGKNSPPVSEPTDPVVPNVFTPNNDGQNDLLTLSSLHTWNGKKQVVIRNRWGETVYKTDSYNNAIAFDGKNRKGAVPAWKLIIPSSVNSLKPFDPEL